MKISLNQIQNDENGTNAYNILITFGYIQPDNVELDFLREIEKLGNVQIKKAVAVLEKYSLATVEKGQSSPQSNEIHSVSIHRLLQQVIRHNGKDIEKEILRKILKCKGKINYLLIPYTYAEKHEDLKKEFYHIRTQLIDQVKLTDLIRERRFIEAADLALIIHQTFNLRKAMKEYFISKYNHAVCLSKAGLHNKFLQILASLYKELDIPEVHSFGWGEEVGKSWSIDENDNIRLHLKMLDEVIPNKFFLNVILNMNNEPMGKVLNSYKEWESEIILKLKTFNPNQILPIIHLGLLVWDKIKVFSFSKEYVDAIESFQCENSYVEVYTWTYYLRMLGKITTSYLSQGEIVTEVVTILTNLFTLARKYILLIDHEEFRRNEITSEAINLDLANVVENKTIRCDPCLQRIIYDLYVIVRNKSVSKLYKTSLYQGMASGTIFSESNTEGPEIYFVNLKIVNTNKGNDRNENFEHKEIYRIKKLQKSHASKNNGEDNGNYLATTITQLSRRDRVAADNDFRGTFTKVNPILTQSISRILIYGSPGTGKTTLCKKIVHDFCNKDLWGHLDEVVWIPLRQLKDSKFDQDEMDEEKLLKIFLNDKKLNVDLDNVLFILDGWDEIQDLLSDPKKAKLVENIHKIKARKNLILTSRPYVQLDFSEYQRVLEITGFNDKNVWDYIKAVLQQNNRLSEQGNIMEYISNYLLSDLVTIPLILEIILFTWEEISTMDKNDIKTTKLYETFILKLSKNFLAKTGINVIKNITLKELINGPLVKEFKMLMEMAKKWVEDGSLQFVYADFEKPNERLKDKLPFLNSSNTGDWRIERSEFVHLTFLEFFAAFELLNREEEEFRQFVAENKFNPKYFVVFTFVAGLIDADLHNLQQFGESPYRYSKEEKLNLYFDYLQSDPVDLAGKYIYTLLIDCMHESQLSQSRETSIYQEISTFASKEHYHSKVDGRRIFAGLRRFPLGLMEQFLNCGTDKVYQLYPYKYTFPQLTDDQVENIFKADASELSKLEVLCKQCSFSRYSSEIITKLLSFEFLRNNWPKTYSNLPFSVLEKVVKLLMNKDVFETETVEKEFNKYKGISGKDAIKLCGQLVKITNDESFLNIITKLVLSDVDEEILFFLENVHEFVEEMPEALLGILNNDKFSQNTTLCRKVMKLIRLFNVNSLPLVEKLLQILDKDEKLKYQALKTIAYIFHREEMPAEVANYALKYFKSLLDSEKERMQIQNRLMKDYLVSMDRKSNVYGLLKDWKFDERTYTVKGFISALKNRCSPLVVQLLIDLFLGTPVKDLPLDILQEKERFLFKIFPVIVNTKTQEGHLHIKTAISSIINSHEDSLREMVNVIDLDLICETIKEMLVGLTEKGRPEGWKWTVKRIFYTMTEIQRYSVKTNCQQKCAPKYGDEKCVYHAHLLTSEILRELFESERINVDSTIGSAVDSEEDLFKTMMYICYEQSDYCILLWAGLLECGVEDSEYQEKVTDHTLHMFGQDIEIEFKAQLLRYLSKRVHRLTKGQLTLLLKYEGEEKDYESGENRNEDRSFLLYIARYSENDLLDIHKFIKDCIHFSEDEQTDLRKLSPSYDRFCREDSDLEILQQIEELVSHINETLNSPATKEILNAIAEYMKDCDILKFGSKIRSICLEMYGHGIDRIVTIADAFFPAKYAKQYIITNYILDEDRNPEFMQLKKKIEKLAKKSFSDQVIQKIYEKLDDEILGPYFLNALERREDTNIVSMLKCINDSSNERQKYYMTYALVQSLVGLDDNIPVYIFKNNLYMGTSVSNKPVLPSLNQHQRDILFNAWRISISI